MRHAEKLKGFNNQAAAAVKVFEKAGMSQSFIDEFKTQAKMYGPDVVEVEDDDPTLIDGLLVGLGDHGLDVIDEAFYDLAEKTAVALFAAGLTDIEDEPMGSELFWAEIRDKS